MNPREKLREFLDVPLFSLGDQPLDVGKVLLVLVIVVATFWIARRVRLGAARALRYRIKDDEQAVSIYSRLAGAIFTIVGLGFALQTTGLHLTALFAASGLVAVAVGFATQSLIQNFVSGIVLRFEGAIKLNDILEVGGRMVKIQKMMMRAVVARDLDDQDHVIPNAELAQTAVVNYTLRDPSLRLRTLVGVVYSSDMRRVREVLQQAAQDVPWRSKQRKPLVYLKGFGSSSVDYEISVWMNDPWQAQRRRSDLNEAIWFALADAGITIAFPQLDVHFDPKVTSALSAGSTGPRDS